MWYWIGNVLIQCISRPLNVPRASSDRFSFPYLHTLRQTIQREQTVLRLTSISNEINLFYWSCHEMTKYSHQITDVYSIFDQVFLFQVDCSQNFYSSFAFFIINNKTEIVVLTPLSICPIYQHPNEMCVYIHTHCVLPEALSSKLNGRKKKKLIIIKRWWIKISNDPFVVRSKFLK